MTKIFLEGKEAIFRNLLERPRLQNRDEFRAAYLSIFAYLEGPFYYTTSYFLSSNPCDVNVVNGNELIILRALLS